MCNMLSREIAAEIDKQILMSVIKPMDCTYNEYAMRKVIESGDCMTEEEFNEQQAVLARF